MTSSFENISPSSDSSLLTIEDLDLSGKTVVLRVDINTPIDPKTLKLLELNRIMEAAVTIKDLSNSKVVVMSHQGRVGRYDYIPLEQHAEALSKVLGKEVKFVDDVFGPAAREAISSLQDNQVLLLDNLRFTAEENVEYTPEAAANTYLVRKLAPLFDACVLDAFPTAHRSSPSIVGFAEVLPTCGGRLIVKELKTLNRILKVAKGPYVAVLGGAKVSDRIEAVETLISNKRADKVLLCGLLANVFLRAVGKLRMPLGIDKEEQYVKKAHTLLDEYPDVFEFPSDVAVERSGERVEVRLEDLREDEAVYDIGHKTVENYSKIIRGAGTVFMSGPPGFFEKEGFGYGTESLLRSMASSFATTIVSGGHLSAALQKFGIKEWIDHVSTAGGALVLYLAGKRLPLIEALYKAA
ncbi:MAG: phosphoglycerate kinase, partial [Nitrososphaerales archaeon]